MKRNKMTKRIVSLFLIFCLTFTYVPLSVSGNIAAYAVGDGYEKTVDAPTWDSWKNVFGPGVMHTQNAGGVWVDKSVFADASAFPANTVSLNGKNNFLVALSALAANKEIVGYSTIPTDTMLVLDVSASMTASAVSNLVTSANSAINKLYETNRNNRVGVVLYSGTRYQGPSEYADGTTLLLPLDRYTTGENGVYLNYSGGSISVNSQVRNSTNNSVSASKVVTGGTYIQAGLYEALLQFEAADTVIEQGNFQSGQSRLPILVLMSDGAPTLATHYYDEVNKEYTVVTQNNRPGRPGGSQQTTTSDENTAGRGGGTSDELAFLTQLTASYVLSRMEEHYGCAGEGLFYTLGLALAGSPEALSVLDPERSTSGINTYWNSFFELGNTSSLSLSVPNPKTNGNTTVSVTRNPAVTTQHYVDEYFEANTSEELIRAFDDIVKEILIQSRYYATDLEGGNPDFSGYLTFEDKIGGYMEVKDVKGILLGDVLFDGHMLASKLNTDGSDGLGSVANPSALGDEFIASVKQRLGISELTDAMSLIENAYKYGQLAYNADGESVTWSNYIGWYAKADGSYAGFWHEGVTSAPADAVYKIKSYGFLGKAEGNIKDSDMMFMTVQVRESVLTGEQTVIWKIPAALVPMVTYKVSLDGDSVENAANVSLTREDAQPIRLVFETGLRSYLNELNISSVKDAKHVAPDGSRIFWTNHWDNSAAEHINHETTTVGFTPSEENERYYYTTDAIVYKKDGENYVPVQSSETLVDGTTYYHARFVFSSESTTAYNYYEPISAQSLAMAKESESNGVMVWVIPQGTIYRYLEDGMWPKGENLTNSILFSHFPYITHTNASYEMDAKLGNNGMLRVYPATGIALTKNVDVTEPGTSTTFKFRISLADASGAAVSGSFDALLANARETTGEEMSVTFTDGVLEVELDAGKTLYIIGLDAGTQYSVEEISDNTDYRVKSVHVNGEFLQGDVAYGRIAQYSLDDVDFLNTPTTEGNLYITKRVEHPYGSNYSLDDKGLSFKITAELVYDGEPLANKTYTLVSGAGQGEVTTDAEGKFTVELAPGETVSVHGIPEETEYTITEEDIAGDGFTLDRAKSTALTGSISSVENARATVVNSYEALPVSPEDNEITVEITKNLIGRDWKQGDRFEFVIEELHPETFEPIDTVATIVIDDSQELTKLFDLTDESYGAVGTYHYRIREVAGPSDNGITYDEIYRRFHVSVTDVDMDGALEIAGVEDVARTTVTEDGGNYNVAAEFTNSYAPYVGDTVVIEIQKLMADDNFGLNGFKFALYDPEGTQPVVESNYTDTQGKAKIELVFSATDLGEHVYLLEEMYTGINGMTYSDAVYTVTVTVSDNGDGTVSADYVITDASGAAIVGAPTFENTYDPTDAQLVLSGMKKLTGRLLARDEFSFELYETAAGFSTDGVIAKHTVKNAFDGSFIFPTLTFDHADTYYFVIKEVKGDLGGITYDETEYKITVVVTDNNGVLEVSHDLDEDIVFNNTYTPTNVSVSLEGDKILTGRDIADGEFEFVLSDSEGKEIAKTENEKNKFFFDSKDIAELTFDRAGKYVFTVTETEGSLGGVTYDGAVYTVTVTVTDDSRGALHASVSYAKDGVGATGIVFRNAYAPAAYDITLDGDKTLSGRDISAGEFEFTLTGGLTGNVLETVKNEADGSFSFTAITVQRANTYHFKVTERNTELGGVRYDTSVYDVYVTVKDDGNGSLYESGRRIEKNGNAANAVVFENSYSAAPIFFTLNGTKKLDGRDLSAGEFEFALYEAKLDAADKIVKDDADPETVKNAADGSFAFTEIEYKNAGKYYYIIEETAGNLGGIKYDTTIYYVTVTVKDNLDGTLSASAEYSDGTEVKSEIIFTNTYSTDDTSLTLGGTKKLDGRDLGAGEFEFVLYEAKLDASGKIVKDDADPETVKNAADGSFSFEKIEYSKAGIYYYVIEETAGNLGGIKYDTTTYYVTVTVKDNLDGTLSASAEYSDGTDAKREIIFTNTYSTDDTSLTLGGTKKLDGRGLNAGEFEFALYEAKLDASGKIVKDDADPETVKNASNGSFSFEKIEYTKAGTYYYVIEETAGNLGGIKYDTTTYYVTVTVKDNLDGTLSASAEYSDGTDAKDEIVFTNIYSTDDTSLTLGGTKKLEGRDLGEGEFSFKLYDAKLDASGKIVKDDDSPETVKNAADGSFSFEKIEYAKTGTYYYIIEEAAGNAGGIKYDTTTYYVTVTVKDNLDGTLSAVAEYSDGTDAKAEIVFTNIYSTGDTSLTIGGTKKLEGRDLAAGEFEFALYEAKLDAAGKIVKDDDSPETVKNAADGSFSFEKIEYAKAGTYYYIIEEVAGNAGGVTYDKTVYYVTVTVTDNLDGTLSAAATFKTENASAEKVVFENKYAPTVSASVSIEGTKKLEGRDLAAGEFSFKLYEAKLDESGKIVRVGEAIKTVVNAKNGHIDFGELTFGEAGKVYFIIEEDMSANAEGITYDTTVYYVTVDVTDGGDGAFDADVKIESSKGTAADEIVFENVYEKIDNPPTGDGGLWMYCALALISGGLLLTLTLKKKKEQR